MKTTALKVQERTDMGKRFTKALRKENKVPGVVYDNSAAKHIVIDAKEVRKAIYTADTYIVQLDIEGTQQDAIIREVQFHPVTEKILHIDFLRVSDKPVEVMLPIRMVGTPVGVIDGGKLTTKLRKVKVKGVPASLPDSVEIDVSPLKLGSSLKVEDIKSEGLVIVTDASTAVAGVEVPRSLRGVDGEGEEEGEGEEAEAEEGAEE